MKKTIFATLVFLVSALLFGCWHEVSQIDTGDKSVPDTRESITAFDHQIDNYLATIDQLQGKNQELLFYQRQDSSGNYTGQTRNNDSLIIVYQNKVHRLEEQRDEFIVRSAGKDRIEATHFEGHDPRHVADAYATMKYADALGGKKANLLAPQDSNGFQGIVINDWFWPVIVQVAGPAGFSAEFNLAGRGASQIFTIPMAGKYTATFATSEKRKSVTKAVSLTNNYYYKGKAYDFMVTLPAK